MSGDRCWCRWILGWLVGFAALVSAPGALAATITVNAVGPTEVSGKTTLTDAITQANSDGGANTITFQSGLGTVTVPAEGLPVITDSNLTIDGCAGVSGSPTAGGCHTVSARLLSDQSALGSGLFDVNAPDVTITGLVVDDSGAGDNNNDQRLVYGEAAATNLKLTNDTFKGNPATQVPAIEASSDDLQVGGLDPSTHKPSGGVTVSNHTWAVYIDAGANDVIEGSTFSVQADGGIYLGGGSSGAKVIANTLSIPSATGGYGVQLDAGEVGADIGDSALQAPPNTFAGFTNAVWVVSGANAFFYDNTGSVSSDSFYLEDTPPLRPPTIQYSGNGPGGIFSGTAAPNATVEVIGSQSAGPPGAVTRLDGVLAKVSADGSGAWSWQPPSGKVLPPYVTAIATASGVGSSQTAAWHPTYQTVSVTEKGNGSGTVTSQPAGISCPGTCSETTTTGTTVTLTATPASGSVFSGWSGGGCSGTGQCSVSVGSASSVTATFSQAATLTVTLAGATNSDLINSNPAGIFCAPNNYTTCSATFAAGTVVTLTASDYPSGGSIFTGWSGEGCSGTSTCTVIVSGAVKVTALFGSLPSIGHTTTTPPLFWTRPAYPNGAFTVHAMFPYAVSCPSTAMCVAVGQDYYQPTNNQSNDRPAIAVSTSSGIARTWQIGEAADPSSEVIVSVSCPTTSFCAAGDDAGNVLTSTDPAGGIGTWTLTHVDSNQPITGISCATPSNCVGVDGLGNAILSENPTGGSGAWRVKAIDYPNELNAVSCPALGTCVATDNSGKVLVAIGSSATNTPASESSWTPTVIDNGHSIGSISCVQALCAATDDSGNIITTTNVTGGPGAWSVAHVSSKPMRGISCSTPTFCVTGDQGSDGYDSVNPTGGASAWQSGSLFMDNVSCVTALIHLLGQDTYCVSVAPGDGVSIGTIPELTIYRYGTGTYGTVSVAPTGNYSGITCTPTCVGLYSLGTVLTLNAAPPSGEALSGWSGCTASGLTCTVTMNASANVAAIFSVAPAKPSGGTVTVTSGSVTTTIACKIKTACAGTITYTVPLSVAAKASTTPKPKMVVIGTGTFSLKADKSGKVKVALNAEGKKLAKAHKLKKVTATIAVKSSHHKRLISTASLKVKY